MCVCVCVCVCVCKIAFIFFYDLDGIYIYILDTYIYIYVYIYICIYVYMWEKKILKVHKTMCYQNFREKKSNFFIAFLDVSENSKTFIQKKFQFFFFLESKNAFFRVYYFILKTLSIPLVLVAIDASRRSLSIAPLLSFRNQNTKRYLNNSGF